MSKYKINSTIQLKMTSNEADNINVDSKKLLDFFIEWCNLNNFKFNGMQTSFILDSTE
jgi:hypothetical protein